MKKSLSLAAVMSLSLLNAGEFHSVGGMSMSMGGAGVASASGSLAGYYNPALLAGKKGVEVSLGVGVGFRENNIGEGINTLSDLELNSILNRIADNTPISGSNTKEDTENIITAQDTLKDIGDENGISLMPTVHLGVQYDDMAIGVYATSDVALSANIDKNHLGLSVENDGNYYSYTPETDSYAIISRTEYEQSSLKYALDNNLTTIKANGLAVVEIPISYGHSFDLPQGKLAVGGSLKFMQGTTYVQTLEIDSEDPFDNIDDNKKDSDNIGIDLGLLFKPTELSNLSLGLVAKNINQPTFDTANGGELQADLQIRTGVEYRINDEVEIAGDLDLTTNKTLIKGYESQILGGGINYHPFLGFSLRGGLMQNLANSNDGLVYTAGFSVGFEKFNLDVSAQMSNKTGQYDGEDVPKYAKVNVALVSKW